MGNSALPLLILRGFVPCDSKYVYELYAGIGNYALRSYLKLGKSTPSSPLDPHFTSNGAQPGHTFHRDVELMLCGSPALKDCSVATWRAHRLRALRFRFCAGGGRICHGGGGDSSFGLGRHASE